MNEANRDTEIAKAIDRLPVPEHSPDFWGGLEARLDDEDGGATVARRRPGAWSGRRLYVGAAAATALVVGAALLIASGGDDSRRVDTGRANPSETSAPTTVVVNPGGGSLQTRRAPDEAVLDWLRAIAQGDAAGAAALVGPKSRAYVEALGGDLEGFMRESQEGYGAWEASPDRNTTEVDLGIVDGSETTIVVVSGTWTGEGHTGFRADAIPSVRVGNGWVVEPFAFRADTGGRLEITSPVSDGEGGWGSLEADAVLSATAVGTGDFYFSLDDQPAVEVAGQRNGGGVRATWDPPGRMSEQTHLLVVAYADGDTLTAAAARFRVGEPQGGF